MKNFKYQHTKRYKLGESHTVNIESLSENNWEYNIAAAQKEFRILKILKEVYKQTDVSQIDTLLIEVSEAMQDYNVDDVKNLNFKDFVVIVEEGDYLQKTNYNPLSKTFLMVINKKCLQHIKDYVNIDYIKNKLKSILVHEDTHKQQDLASDGKFFNPKKYTSFDIDVTKYLNQRTEIDAYARQFGYELKKLYSTEGVESIFNRIFELNIDDAEIKDNLETLFDSLTKQNQKFFLRNLYDYLVD